MRFAIKFNIVCFSILLLFFPMVGFSQTNLIESVNNQIGLAFKDLYQNYGEHNSTGYLDREYGYIPGGGLFVTKLFNHAIYTNINVDVYSGSTTYEGHFQTGEYVKSHGDNFIFNPEARVGYYIPIQSDTSITPYLALGYYRWQRDGGTTTVPFDGDEFTIAAMSETYQNWYAGPGFLLQHELNNQWVVSFDAMVGTTFNSTMATAIPVPTDDSAISLGMNFNLGSRPYYNLGVGANYFFDKNVQVLAKVNYRQFGYGASSTNALGVMEPESKTHQTIFTLGVAYSFE